jgi:serine/threonine protein kinase
MEPNQVDKSDVTQNCVANLETESTEDHTSRVPSRPKENFWIDGRYFVLKFLGEGAFGAVFLVFDSLSRQYLAMKMPKHQKYLPMFVKEVHNMQQLSDAELVEERKAIAHLLDFNIGRGVMISTDNEVYANDVTYFITHYAEQGDLASQIIEDAPKYKQGIDELEIFEIFQQLLEAIEAIHEQGFVHLDLKPDNVLVFSNSKVAISDFALSRDIKGEDNKGNFLSYRAGAKQYWSPEMFTDHPYNGVQTDIFALGVILFIITFG